MFAHFLALAVLNKLFSEYCFINTNEYVGNHTNDETPECINQSTIQSIVYQVDVCLFEAVALLIEAFHPTIALGISGGVTLQCSLFFSSVYVPSANFKMPSANYKLPSATFMDHLLLLSQMYQYWLCGYIIAYYMHLILHHCYDNQNYRQDW